MLKIKILEEIGKDLDNEDAVILRLLLTKEIEKGNQVELDFKDTEILTGTFYSIMAVPLISKYGSEKYNKCVKVTNLKTIKEYSTVVEGTLMN